MRPNAHVKTIEKEQKKKKVERISAIINEKISILKM
jgi:hypothetical protein